MMYAIPPEVSLVSSFLLLGGVGFQELLLIAIFLFIVGTPVIVILFMLKAKRKMRQEEYEFWTSKTSDQSTILKNAEKLKELKALQERGVISAVEFESEKKKILGS